MKVAVMQPYFFPYAGYFQLIDAVDYFVIFDDVNYIKRGWINRNRILHNGQIVNITLPVQKASQNRKINQHLRTTDIRALDKLKRTIEQSYAKAPFFDEVFPLCCDIINCEEDNLAAFLKNSLMTVSSYLGMNTRFVYSSDLSDHADWNDAQQRIIAITKQLGGREYLNLPGGKTFYDENEFFNQNVKLNFINPDLTSYCQLYTREFQPGLSIIDLMFQLGSPARRMV